MIMSLILLILAIPVGLLIACMCKDELVDGRKWFVVLFIVGVIFGLWFFLIDNNVVGYTLIFISIISLVSYIKSFNKKWTRK